MGWDCAICRQGVKRDFVGVKEKLTIVCGIDDEGGSLHVAGRTGGERGEFHDNTEHEWYDYRLVN